MTKRCVVLDLTATLQPTNELDVVFDGERFVEVAQRGSWFNFVVSNPATRERSIVVRDVWRRVREMSLEAAFLIDGTAATVETSLTVAHLALDAAGVSPEFVNMTLMESLPRIALLQTEDELHSMYSKLLAADMEQVAMGLWLQTHLDTQRWPVDPRGSEQFEHRWWALHDHSRGFLWPPGVHLQSNDRYAMQPLTTALALLPSLREMDRSSETSSDLYPDNVLEEALRGCLLLVITKVVEGSEPPLLMEFRARADVAGMRLLRFVEESCDVDAWQSLTHGPPDVTPLSECLIEVARSERDLIVRLSERQQALDDAVWSMRAEVERTYLQPGSPGTTERISRLLWESMSNVRAAVMKAEKGDLL